MFKKGDRVRHKSDNKEAVIIDVLNRIFVEVEHDDQTYYWQQKNLILIEDDEDPFDIWNADVYGDYFDTNYNFDFTGGTNEEIKCICDSWTLFHFGCKCGAFEKEQNERERRNRGSDLDRKDKI